MQPDVLIRLQQCSTASKVLVCFSLLCVWETSLWGILILNSGINVWFYNDYSRLKYTATEPFISYHFGGFFVITPPTKKTQAGHIHYWEVVLQIQPSLRLLNWSVQFLKRLNKITMNLLWRCFIFDLWSQLECSLLHTSDHRINETFIASVHGE